MRSAWLVGCASVACLLGCSVALAAGCSGGTEQPPPSADAGDTGAQEAAATDGGADAPPDNDQDPDVYPADHQPVPQIDFNGGNVLSAPRLVTITFTGDVHRDGLRGYDHKIMTTSYWHQVVAGYCSPPDSGTCIGDGVTKADDGGFWHPDGSTADAGDGYLDVEMGYDFGSTSITDGDIRSWLEAHINAGDFPASDAQTLYALYFPTGVTVTSGSGSSCAQFLGYHSGGNNGFPYAYAVLPRCTTGGGPKPDFDQLTIVASHEFAEAATDPFNSGGSTFYLHSNDAWIGALGYGGGENGDMCQYVVPWNWNESGWQVQRIWSNLAAAKSEHPCQPAVKPAFFAAAVRTKRLHVTWGGQDHWSDGYVVVPRGQSVDAIADVFSEKPLPHDLLLYAGKDKGSGHDPSDMGAPEQGVTVDLSRNQVHNGNALTVTFHAPANAQANSDVRLVVRAVLESDDYNDWPVLVHIK